MKFKGAAVLVFVALAVKAHGQAGWAKPAFPGQTNAPKPAKLSPPFTVETVTNRLSGPWSIAFLPSGNFLITEANGTMRVVRPVLRNWRGTVVGGIRPTELLQPA